MPAQKDGLKKCNKCGVVKKIEEFYKNKGMPGGFLHQCKKCWLELCSQYYKQNTEKINQCVKKYYKNNAEEKKKYAREYNQKNKEKIAQHKSKVYREDPKKEKARVAGWNYKRRLQAYEILGGAFCVRCKRDDLEALSINHKNHDGGERRKDGEPSGSRLYMAIINGTIDISDLEVTCMTCNWAHYWEHKHGGGHYEINWVPKKT